MTPGRSNAPSPHSRRRTRPVPAWWRSRVAASYPDLLADPEIEAVYNPLPNALHGPWNLAAVRAGRHVLSEKSFAANAEEPRPCGPAYRCRPTPTTRSRRCG
jgi:predicted dehydrogenase